MKYRIMQSKTGVFRAFDENDSAIDGTYAMTAEECEALLRGYLDHPIDTTKVWKVIDTDDHTPICGECGESTDDCACETTAPEGDLNAIL